MSSYYERKTEEQEAMDAVREHAEVLKSGLSV
jgi:hypothetical protein